VLHRLDFLINSAARVSNLALESTTLDSDLAVGMGFTTLGVDESSFGCSRMASTSSVDCFRQRNAPPVPSERSSTRSVLYHSRASAGSTASIVILDSDIFKLLESERCKECERLCV
jgi:hypothetical protein